MSKKPVALIILDGFGYTPVEKGNAVKYAKTPNIDKYMEMYPHNLIKCSGMDVGLPDGQMGNSEVGHTNIGAGRVVYQELTRITKAIQDGDFFENETLLKAVENCKKNDSALHIMGLLSDGGVHSHNTHLYAIVELADGTRTTVYDEIRILSVYDAAQQIVEANTNANDVAVAQTVIDNYDAYIAASAN